MHTRRFLWTGLVALLACSSGGATSGGASAARRGGANLITAEEIVSSGGNMESALDIVERLRPTMMRPRASTFGAVRSDGTQGGESIPVVAFVDEIRLGDVTNLRSVPAAQVLEIRYISATDATQRWGTGYSSGVIQVITKK
jgi:hypothetical protein